LQNCHLKLTQNCHSGSSAFTNIFQYYSLDVSTDGVSVPESVGVHALYDAAALSDGIDQLT